MSLRNFWCQQELVARKLPKLAKHLKGLNCDMSIIATDWFLCLFCTALPSEVPPSSPTCPFVVAGEKLGKPVLWLIQERIRLHCCRVLLPSFRHSQSPSCVCK